MREGGRGEGRRERRGGEGRGRTGKGEGIKGRVQREKERGGERPRLRRVRKRKSWRGQRDGEKGQHVTEEL